jgi:hypothetical protein
MTAKPTAAAVPLIDLRGKLPSEVDVVLAQHGIRWNNHWEPVGMSTCIDSTDDDKLAKQWVRRLRKRMTECDRKEPGIRWLGIALYSFGVSAYAAKP